MNAWIQATKNSKPIITDVMINGNNEAAKPAKPKNNVIKLINTFSRICPAIIFAKRRTDNVTGRKRYDKTSMGIKIGAMYQGVPWGKNKLKNPKPCLTKPIIVTNINTSIAKIRVTNIWLVKVKE